MAESFRIVYATEAVRDLHTLRAFDRKSVFTAVEEHLTFEPTRESRSRIKRMSQPFWSQFRLRSGDFRVYYDVQESERVVQVLRILFKGTASISLEQP